MSNFEPFNQQTILDITNQLTTEMKTKSRSFIDEFIAQGRQEGRKEGREEGREEGMKKGIEKGSLQSRYEFARKLLLRKMPLEDICELTDLTLEEVTRLVGDQ